LTVPLKRNAKFIVIPISAAKLVNIPSISAIPTNTSPQQTIKLKSPALGSATASRNVAHQPRSEEHTSELQSVSISYAVYGFKESYSHSQCDCRGMTDAQQTL